MTLKVFCSSIMSIALFSIANIIISSLLFMWLSKQISPTCLKLKATEPVSPRLPPFLVNIDSYF